LRPDAGDGALAESVSAVGVGRCALDAQGQRRSSVNSSTVRRARDCISSSSQVGRWGRFPPRRGLEQVEWQIKG